MEYSAVVIVLAYLLLSLGLGGLSMIRPETRRRWIPNKKINYFPKPGKMLYESKTELFCIFSIGRPLNF